MRFHAPTPVQATTLRLFLLVSVLMLTAFGVMTSPLDQNPMTEQPTTEPSILGRDEFNYPNVPRGHPHMRLLLDNAFQYVNPVHGIVDPASGYPVEGWNQDPDKGLFLRSFTQLTAIGTWIELLANVAAGYADNPFFSRESALDGLSLAVNSLLEDQRNPSLAAKGLLVNFLGLDGGDTQGSTD